MTDGVDLYWIPLGAGAGGALVRWSGRYYEAIAPAVARRQRQPLFHSALEVRVNGATTTIEMTPVWITRGERGVVAEGAVGLRVLGRWSIFRYEVRRWAGGSIPDAADAIGGAVRISDDAAIARRVLDRVAMVPTATWGRDELGTGDMWNSNSLVSWSLASAGSCSTTSDLRTAAAPLAGSPGWRSLTSTLDDRADPAGIASSDGRRLAFRHVRTVARSC